MVEQLPAAAVTTAITLLATVIAKATAAAPTGIEAGAGSGLDIRPSTTRAEMVRACQQRYPDVDVREGAHRRRR